MRSLLVLALVGVTLAPASIPDPQTAATVHVGALRFLRPTGATLVEGMVSVPFAAVSRLAGDAVTGFGTYRLTMVVRDTAGLALTEQTWSQRVPARLLGVEGGSAVELFRFGVAPGAYTVEVALTDSASGRVARGQVGVEAFSVPPLASDLVLSPAIRQAAGPEDTTSAAGEMRRGGMFITVQPLPVLTPSSSNLFYYVELYRREATTATLRARVLGTEGRQVVAGAPLEVEVAAGGGTAASGIPLAGLPQGEYALELEVAYPDTTVRVRGAFRMAGAATAEQAAAAAQGGAQDFFAQQSEAQLDTLYAPLMYIQERDERGVYDGLSLDGKRNYLRQFWARRGAELQRRYYSAFAEANREFAETGGGRVPGWRTDRGRVHLKYGPPDQVLRRPQAGSTMPYEVWKYTRGQSRKFLFLDRTGLGNYQLIYTDDRRETSLPDWETILGAEAAEEVRRF